MPRNQFQKTIFALLTVIVTVHAYAFFSLYVLHGDMLKQLTGQTSVIAAIHMQGGVYMFGTYLPIWSLILIEFALAFTLELIMGSPCSFRLTCKVFPPKETHPVLFETALICATVALMCPAMSLLAAIIYYPFYEGFHVLRLLANWLQLMCYNFPFALITQLFFIQPLIRTIFKFLFRRDIASRTGQHKNLNTPKKRAA